MRLILILLACTACTPREFYEEPEEYGPIAPEPNPTHNNWVAPSKGQYIHSHGMTKHDDTTRIRNQRQYPPRHEKNRGWGQQNRGA